MRKLILTAIAAGALGVAAAPAIGEDSPTTTTPTTTTPTTTTPALAPVERQKESAAKKCKAERAAMGREAFAQKYGKNKNKRNAFGKCVSAARKAAKAGETEAPTTQPTVQSETSDDDGKPGRGHQHGHKGDAHS
jgi:hypothetical protein